jgi:hypothetical protein
MGFRRGNPRVTPSTSTITRRNGSRVLADSEKLPTRAGDSVEPRAADPVLVSWRPCDPMAVRDDRGWISGDEFAFGGASASYNPALQAGALRASRRDPARWRA